MHNCSFEIDTLYKAPEGYAVGWRRLYQDEFLHSIHMLSSTGPFFKLAFSVICYCLMKHQTQWLKQNPFHLFAPKSQLGCSTGAGDSTSEMASVTALASWYWVLARSLNGDPGWGLSFLRHAPIHVIRLDFSQQGSFRIVRSYLIAGFPQSAEAEATGFLKTSTKQTHHHFRYILLVTKWVHVQGEGTTNACEYLEYCSLRAIKVYY